MHKKDWRLNERMYGGLTGLNKKETTELHGADQVKAWRRSYDTPPPPVETDSPFWPGNDNRYAHIPRSEVSYIECRACSTAVTNDKMTTPPPSCAINARRSHSANV